MDQVQRSEEFHERSQPFTCKNDVGGARFGLVPPADVAVAELPPAAEFTRVRRGGVDQGQLAVALVLLHTVNKSKAGARWGWGLAPISPCSIILADKAPAAPGRVPFLRWH